MLSSNKPITRKDIIDLGWDKKSGIEKRTYLHSGPNRMAVHFAMRDTNYKHNNRATTKGRKTQRVALEKAVVVNGQVDTVKTGIMRSIRKINYWKFGGNTTHPGRTR